MEQALDSLSFGGNGNWVDLLFLATLIYFVATNRGLIATLIEVMGFFFALFVSYSLYNPLGRLVAYGFAIPQGISQVIGFFLAWFVVEMLFYIAIYGLFRRSIARISAHRANAWLGAVVAGVQACIIFLFFISLIFALPVRPNVKADILDSRTGPFFVSASRSFEASIKNVFGQAVTESLNFLTIRPASNESVDLGFRKAPTQLTIDTSSEEVMLGLVNRERVQRGLPALTIDPDIVEVSREYAREMLEHGFFSHNSKVDGSEPADRAERGGIEYQVYGENLAYAPDVYIAHQGLMNSPGHRKNILSPEYSRVGIGVVDAGPLGKMFVQNFAD